MLAPLQFLRNTRRSALSGVLLACAIFATGCAVPGVGHLRPPTRGLPAVFGVLPDDMIGLTLLDPDASAGSWTALEGALGAGASKRIIGEWNSRVFGDDAPDGWVGPVIGTGWRTLAVGSTRDSAVFQFAAVRNRGVLESALRSRGWERQDVMLAAGPDQHELTVWSAPARLGVGLPVLAVDDDGLIAAATIAALRHIVPSESDTTVADRKATAMKVVDAMHRTPAAFVFRTDLARGQLRRRFANSPATLELAKWATSSSFISALHDGWIGLAPPRDRSRHAVRLVGSADWAGVLSPDWEPKAADRTLLEQLPETVSTAVALRDPGALVGAELRTIAQGGVDFATEQDVPKGDQRVELFPLLDRLDGQAAVGFDRANNTLHAEIDRRGDDDLKADVRNALKLAGVDASVKRDGGRLSVSAQLGTTKHAVSSGGMLGDDPAFRSAMLGAGAPRRSPALWLWQRSSPCASASGGWVTWNGGGTMDLSVDVALDPAAKCDPASGVAKLATLRAAQPA